MQPLDPQPALIQRAYERLVEAIADGTLAPGNIQENSFIPTIGMRKAAFWQKNKARAEKHEADEVLSYMTFMLERATAEDVPVRQRDFAEHGKTVKLFRGVTEWFDHINAYAKKRHVKLQHFVISSGIKEMIEATKIGKKFTIVPIDVEIHGKYAYLGRECASLGDGGNPIYLGREREFRVGVQVDSRSLRGL